MQNVLKAVETSNRSRFLAKRAQDESQCRDLLNRALAVCCSIDSAFPIAFWPSYDVILCVYCLVVEILKVCNYVVSLSLVNRYEHTQTLLFR